jgi:hypothetical protein
MLHKDHNKRLVDCHYRDNQKQFGFKKNSSSGHAAFVLLEVIKNNMRRGKKTLICEIDASKAFDKVDRDYLWHKALKALPTCLVKAIRSLRFVTGTSMQQWFAICSFQDDCWRQVRWTTLAKAVCNVYRELNHRN